MTNKTALLTGGSRGIGKATAEMLRAQGWDVIAPTRAELNFEIQGDMDDFGSEIKKLDALIFCHGEWFSKSLEHQYPNDFHRQFTWRVVHPSHLIHWTLHALKGGSVTMVSSTRGFIGGVDTGPYAAACAAQIALMTGYAREYSGVRFNVVCPGLTDTQMGAQVVLTGGAKPGAAMQAPESVAREIVRLIESDDNGRIMRVVNNEVTEARWTR